MADTQALRPTSFQLPGRPAGSASGTASPAYKRPSIADRLALMLTKAHTGKNFRQFMSATRSTPAVQHRILLEKLWRNRDSDYGKGHGFAAIRTYADFIRQVPIQTYEELRPYVERVMAGDLGALFGGGQRVRMFAMTSGTTEEPKFIPVTDAFLKEYRKGWNVFGIKAVMDHDEAFLRPILQVTSPMDERTSKGGTPCGAISGLMAATQKPLVRRYYIVPRDVAYIPDAAARYYTIMRLAVPADVAFTVTASPATQLKLARAAANHSGRLIRDVHDGTLTEDFDIPPRIRHLLRPRLIPQPDAARRLQKLADRDGRLLPKAYWNLAFLANWMGGTMGLYLRDFPEFFGDTPVRDIGLLASEGRMSVPIADGTSAGILEMTSHFFEFIPVEERDRTTPTILRTHELTVGCVYNVLLTTSAGFYRYDIGDVIRVVAFENTAPIIEFLHKGLHVSSLAGEKLTEQQVVAAFERVAAQLPIDAVLFVLAPRWGDPPYYCLHLELDGKSVRWVSILAQRLDVALGQVSVEYESKRKSDRLGPVRINLLPTGFLAERDAREAVRTRPANEQFKHRYLLNAPALDDDFPVERETKLEATGV